MAVSSGPALGDPMELGALKAALRPTRPLVVGAVKTNIGHLEGAAGIAGVLKAALVVARRRVPPSLHLRCANPHIDLQPGAMP